MHDRDTYTRRSVSRGCPTLISQQVVCDTVSPQSERMAPESLSTKVHREKNLWVSYEVVCFSSERRKKGRKEKGAPLFGIKIQLGLMCDVNHPKAYLRRLTAKPKTVSIQHVRKVKAKSSWSVNNPQSKLLVDTSRTKILWATLETASQ